MPKGKLGEPRPVDLAIGIQDFRAEALDHPLVDSLARLHELGGNVVGENEARAVPDEHLSDYGLPNSNSAREPNSKQFPPPRENLSRSRGTRRDAGIGLQRYSLRKSESELNLCNRIIRGRPFWSRLSSST